eukprot:m.11825 g.11825  ORF g.11825 m.11825 type:complete len:626 (-) comp9000_c0_seq1:97-1974(-)
MSNMARLLQILCVSMVLCETAANMYDVISPWKLPAGKCTHGCAAWTEFGNWTKGWWANESLAAEAGSSCAQLANAPGLSKPAPVLDPTGVGGVGAWCFCAAAPGLERTMSTIADMPTFDYCENPLDYPTQINIQIASPTTVVLSFVTFETVAPDASPIGLVGLDENSLKPSTGDAVTHVYVKAGTNGAGNRTYFMHFVVLPNLAPRTRYFYKVKSGGATCAWSGVYSFRSGYTAADSGEPTRVAIFGDMGIYSWNNMINMQQDVATDAIDLVVHMGDHCYNMGGSNDRRGDGYMEAYQPVIATVPWLPIVGNHEFYDGDELRRYLNQTEGAMIANPIVANPPNHPFVVGASTTADTALGRMLATGNHHGAGSHSNDQTTTTPSGTSRYYSVDFGLIHFVALDLNMYNGVDTCGEPCRQAQLAWLKTDLEAANANRANVPWIVAMSHFPLYCSNCPAPGFDPGAWYESEKCEFEGHNPSCVDEAWDAERHVQRIKGAGGATNKDMVPDFEPLFMQYGVDVYSSGHIHDYEFIYPTYNNTPVQTDFVNPRAPVHLVTGNGGPPSASKFGKIMPWSYEHSSVYSYTRLEVYNSTTMKWIQVANNDSTILTELVVTQQHHGAFPIPPHQ